MKIKRLILMIICSLMMVGCQSQKEETVEKTDLSLWNEEGIINEVVDYINEITDQESEDFIPVEDRIAVFDLDGTLVGEQFPIYFEWLLFTERVLNDDTFEATQEMITTAKEILYAGKSKSIPAGLEEKESQLFGKAFDGMTVEEYQQYVKDFLSHNADGFDHLTFGEAYFKPMQELITYLEDNEFKVYVVSGSDRDADRVFTGLFTDIPNYQIIGSDYYSEGTKHDEVYYLDYQFESDEQVMRDDERIIKNVKSSKVVQISQEIGQKPVLAFGNSTGDTSMFTYTTYNNPYKSAAFCILPDDDEREYANLEKVENLKKICEENNWSTISMKDDFLTIYGNEVIKDENNTSFVDELLSK